jgi:MinD-like ATPase involved in chromosome partitioning or flagellar assembly
MSGERYVLLGLAPARVPWFAALAQWATSATIAAEFIKCVSADEVRARLASGRRHSAVLIDSGAPTFDRDVVDAARAARTPVIAIRDGPRRSSEGTPVDSGVVAELPAAFGRDELLDVLTTHCELIGRGDEMPAMVAETETPMWLGQLLSVCGPGGSGASTAAIALAQGFAADARYSRRVVLADLALRADQAMLHDATDLGPGTQELVEAHRLGRPEPDEVWRTTFDVPRRGYRLLLGLRQPEAWSALRPRAIDASIAGLRRAFQVVVADVTGDVEGETEGGSIEVEERNHLARTAVLHSSVVVVVGAPGMKGVYSLARLVRSLTRIGVAPARIVAVVNRSPRNPRARAELGRALAALLGGSGSGSGSARGAIALAGPIHVPERKLEDVLRDGGPLPAAVVDPLLHAVRAVAERQADSAPARGGAVLVTPGSLGSWPEAAEFGAG